MHPLPIEVALTRTPLWPSERALAQMLHLWSLLLFQRPGTTTHNRQFITMLRLGASSRRMEWLDLPDIARQELLSLPWRICKKTGPDCHRDQSFKLGLVGSVLLKSNQGGQVRLSSSTQSQHRGQWMACNVLLRWMGQIILLKSLRINQFRSLRSLSALIGHNRLQLQRLLRPT